MGYGIGVKCKCQDRELMLGVGMGYPSFYRETMVNNHMTMRPIVGPAHTLEVEILFSIIFYVCMRLSHKHRGKLIAGVCLIFFIAGELLSVFNIDTNIASIDFI